MRGLFILTAITLLFRFANIRMGVVMIIRVVILGLVLIVPSVGNAGFYTGNEIMKVCNEPSSNVTAYNQCLYYLAGIADANKSLKNLTLLALQDKNPFVGGIVGGPFCAPLGITLGQLRQVFLNYMNADPQHWHYSAGTRALGAFENAWPCPK